jgi:hypothetical protein
MTTLLFANNAQSTLAGGITSAALTANLAPGTGVRFPAPGAGQAFLGTFTDAATGLVIEIVLVTNLTGDTITMVRAQEGTVAAAYIAGDNFQHLCTAGTLTQMLQQSQAQPARVITTSGAFTLTNADGAVGLARVTSPAASNTTLPPAPVNGQVVSIEDLAGNFGSFAVTVAPNTGQAIRNFGPPGVINAVLNVNGQCGIFRYYTTGSVWSFKP